MHRRTIWYIHKHTQTHMVTHTLANTHAYFTYMHVYIHATHACKHTYIFYMHVYILVHAIRTYKHNTNRVTHICTNTHIHTCTQIQIDLHTYTHILKTKKALIRSYIYA